MVGKVVAGVAAPAGNPGDLRSAAAAMHRIGGGFGRIGDTVRQAVASVPTWGGSASIEFQGRCVDHQSAASQADVACILAGDELGRYASDLEDAIAEVERMQREAEELEAQERHALAAAADARGRAESASAARTSASLVAVTDGGASARMYDGIVSSAQADETMAARTAMAARTRIEELQGQANAVRERVEQRANLAADRIRAAEDELPAPFGAPVDSAGGAAVTSVTEAAEVGVTLFSVVRVAGNTAVIKERSADGGWHVTMAEGIKGGPTADIPGALVSGSAGLYRVASRAQRFDFPSEREADVFIDHRGKSDHPLFVFPSKGGGAAPRPATLSPAEKAAIQAANAKEPSSTYTEGGVEASGHANFGAKAQAGAEAKDVRGTVTDAATGLTTTYIRVDGSLSGHLGAGPAAHADGSIEQAVTRDSSQRITGYSVTLTGETGSGTHLGADTPKVGYHTDHAQGVRVERTMQLDLTDPVNQEAVSRWTQSHDPESASVLARQLAEGRIDDRTYQVVTDGRDGSVTVRWAGFDGSHHQHSATMISATHSTGTAAPVRTR